MAISARERRIALAAQARQELEALEAAGARMAGNGYSPILLVKGDLNEAERSGGDLLAGVDGQALRAALDAIGWAPEDFCALATVAGAGDGTGPVAAGEPLPTETLREAVEALDPEAVVLLDAAAADAFRAAYDDELSAIEDAGAAALTPGIVASVLGRRMLALPGFEASLSDAHAKQVCWAYLKQLKPLGAPY